MPNHIINEITIPNITTKTQKSILAKTVSSDGLVDFSILLPLPINHWPGNVSTSHKEAFPGDHIDDAIKTWGTKWGAYGMYEEDRYDPVLQSNESIVFTFQTAWAPPRGWTVALFNVFEIDIIHRWYDEGGVDAFTETYLFSGLDEWKTEPWTQNVASDETKSRLHRMLFGD